MSEIRTDDEEKAEIINGGLGELSPEEVEIIRQMRQERQEDKADQATNMADVALRPIPDTYVLPGGDTTDETKSKYESTPQEDYDLIQKMLGGDQQAGHDFYKKYERLVKYFAKKAYDPSRGTRVEENDLRQEGILALIEAARNYRPDNDNQISFAQYVSSFLKGKLISTQEQLLHDVRIPLSAQSTLNKIYKINEYRMNNRMSIMNEQDVMDEFGVPLSRAKELLRAMLLTRYIGSLENGYSSRTDDQTNNDYILDYQNGIQNLNDDNEQSIFDDVELDEIGDYLKQLLNRLSPVEREVIEYRFGLDDDNVHTLDETAKHLEVTRERIRQIEAKALRKMRGFSRKDKVIDGKTLFSA